MKASKFSHRPGLGAGSITPPIYRRSATFSPSIPICKSSLVNAGLRPLMIDEGFEVLPPARVGGRVHNAADLSKIGNVFAFNALSRCMDTAVDSAEMFTARLSGYLARPSEARRLLVFDQFEELFTAFPERWQDRK